MLFSWLLACSLMAGAQSVTNKINSANNKINNTDTSLNNTSVAINNTSNTVSNAGTAFGNLGRTIFGKTNKKAKTDVAKTVTATDSTTQAKQAGTANTIIISIAGADYPTVKKLRESIKSVAGVQSVDMNFNATGSSLSIASGKKADDLWDGLSNDLLAHYNVISMNDNSINVTYKK